MHRSKRPLLALIRGLSVLGLFGVRSVRPHLRADRVKVDTQRRKHLNSHPFVRAEQTSKQSHRV